MSVLYCNQVSMEGLVRTCNFNVWLISEHDAGRQHWMMLTRGQNRSGERRTAVGGEKQLRPFLSPPWASLFCCCFTGVQGCAMNWAAANSHQFVRSSLTVIWEVWGRRGRGSHWCQPSASRVITGHWAVLSQGGGVKNTASHSTRHPPYKDICQAQQEIC